MTPQEAFVAQLGPSLYRKLSERGVENIDSVYDNMMRQLAYESNYGRSRVARNQHNYGGYGWNGKTYTTFKNDDEFVDHYLNIMTGRHKGALKARTPREYAKALKKSFYYEDSLDNYARNLSGMKSVSKAAAAHRQANKDMYVPKFPQQSLIDVIENTPQFQPVPVVAKPVINTDYSLKNTPTQNPKSRNLNAWYGSGSPAYGGYDLRLPSFEEFMRSVSTLTPIIQ